MFIIDHIFSTPTLYFLYGLAFLFLGASIALKDMKASQLKISSNLWLLSLFGFAHGFHEWIALFLLIDGTQYSDDIIYTIKTLALIINGLSFLFFVIWNITAPFNY